MIGWKSYRKNEADVASKPLGFDDFELRLGDVMRGERATLGKSLLDVQRELRIKASYIAAIENCDPSAFETPGFIAGYVRSYARYLNMDPDETYAAFCAESGFITSHGMSDKASASRKADAVQPRAARDVFAQPSTPFAPVSDSIFSQIEAGAAGSILVLIALIGGIGYGGWSVLREVQRVQLSPVDQTPVVLSDLDPVQSTVAPASTDRDGNDVLAAEAGTGAGVFSPPTNDALDRLYRPQALDVPVLVARDAPISTLDPTAVGSFAAAVKPELPRIDTDSAVAAALAGLPGFGFDVPSVGMNDVTLVAVRPAWVRVTSAQGDTLFQGILDAGDTYAVPNQIPAPLLRVGESGAVYFAVNGRALGPAGLTGEVTQGLALSASTLTAEYNPVPAGTMDPKLSLAIASLAPAPAAPLGIPGQPKVLEDGTPGVTILATREAWVRVRSASGATLFESIMTPGDTYRVPQTEQPPTIRTGDAGAIYFAVNGQTYGPYGSSGSIADNLALSMDRVTSQFQLADMTRDTALAKVVAELGGSVPVALD